MATYDFERPLVTVDTVVLTLIAHQLHVLLVKRQEDPAKGEWSLPGGFVHTDKDATAEDSVRRVLSQKAGIALRHMEQIASFTGQTRDRRGWSVSIAYLALVQIEEVDLNENAKWVAVDEVLSLPFDHKDILDAGLRRVRDKAAYSSLPAFLLPETFTLPELERVYEEVLGTPLNSAAFRRKVMDQSIIEVATQSANAEKSVGRPAQLYRLSQTFLQDMGRVVMLPDGRRGGARSK